MNNSTREVRLAGCRFELLAENEEFVGVGRVWIGDTLVRSGRLPLCVQTHSFPQGLEFASLRLLGIDEATDEVRVRLEATYRAPMTQLMRDHSFDPIHNTLDWDGSQAAGTSHLDLVLRSAQDSFNGVSFAGFSYGWEYLGEDVPLHFLLERASWELDGDIVGATSYSQSACTPPVCEFEIDTEWTTEGILHFMVEGGNQNPIMTHNLPRWASHGSFDFQFKGNQTLIGVFEHVDLIRSLVLLGRRMSSNACRLVFTF